MNKTPSFRVKIATMLGGKRLKDFIPPLNPIDGVGFGGMRRINSFSTKDEQITALKGWVFAANGAIADPCAAVEFKLYRKQKDGDRVEVTDHEILDLLAAPNLMHTGEQMRQLHFTYMNIVGESRIPCRCCYMDSRRGMTSRPAVLALNCMPASPVTTATGRRVSCLAASTRSMISLSASLSVW